EFKGGIALVTDADRASEACILRYLRSRFPDHAVLAEEEGETVGAAPFRWFIDPLDGTTNYAHQVPHFCVSIGVEGGGGLLAGVVYDPVRDELFSAAQGRGATLNGRTLKVSTQGVLSRALLATGFPYDIWSRPDAPMQLFDAFIRKAQGVRRMGSAALDLAYVAAGRYDGFFELGLKPWDVAAGALLVLEAGGRATGLGEESLDVSAGRLLASNGVLHAEMQQIVKDARAAARV
ncbi:MAG: inositol monophosphatase family protein, partial [Myxococcales bacterium]